MPATWRVTDLPPATLACGTPRPSRVSISRFGPMLVCVAPVLSEK